MGCGGMRIVGTNLVLFVLALEPTMVTLLNQKSIFEWCMARLVIMYGHQNDIMY
jgi:hypothetical protein